MHSKNNIIEIMNYDEAEEKVVQQIFELILYRYHTSSGNSMKSSDFVFNYVEFLYYKFHKMNINRGESRIVSPDWIKNKNLQENLKMMMMNVFITLQYLQ